MRPRVCVLVAAIALLALLAPPVPPAAAADPDVALFRSEEFGVFFLYDASRWSIVNQESEAGSDIVQLDDGEVSAIVWALDVPDLTPQECLDVVLGDLRDDPGIAEIAPLPTGFDEPDIERDAADGSVDLVLTLAPGDPRRKLVTRESCAELVPGRSLLYTSIAIPGDAWNEGRTLDSPEDLPGFGRSVVPWLAMYVPGADAYLPVVDATGVAVGMIGSIAPCQNGLEQVLAVWAFDGGPGFALDLASVVFDGQTFTEDGSIGPSQTAPLAAEWLRPADAGAGPLAIGPDEVAAFRLPLAVDGFGFVSAVPEGAPRVHLGAVGGGCGAGAAPVRIDME